MLKVMFSALAAMLLGVIGMFPFWVARFDQRSGATENYRNLF